MDFLRKYYSFEHICNPIKQHIEYYENILCQCVCQLQGIDYLWEGFLHGVQTWVKITLLYCCEVTSYRK